LSAPTRNTAMNLLLLQQRQVPSPEVIDRIERVLIDSGAPGPNSR